MHHKQPFHIAFYVDGFTLKKVNTFYRKYHPFHSTLDFLGIKNWARDQALRLFDPPKKYALMDCHYYHPDRDPKSYGSTNDGIFNLERELRYAGFQIHYATRGQDNSPNLALIEDALTFATYRHVDAVILLSTQGQYSPLPDRLGEMGIPMLLLGWNFTFERCNRWVHWKTDSLLRDNSAYYIAMEHVANNNPPSLYSEVSLFKINTRMPSKKETRIYALDQLFRRSMNRVS